MSLSDIMQPGAIALPHPRNRMGKYASYAELAHFANGVFGNNTTIPAVYFFKHFSPFGLSATAERYAEGQVDVDGTVYRF